ncbi:FAD-binding oxidoreductase [Exilibacterium tricleocarpae]|uniref:FAD-binding oxidoreductase n=1 Tax=Exilibacterium tricleocarpae TaxID=2591008 RepID=A0A545TVL6_9GAMM|nr:FAD-binding oxidoreductase [Exilibacterium tricleocarpae]TQV81254.1 FAD-binding oxidoreductase [Exilibacterium tricleocarpae]
MTAHAPPESELPNALATIVGPQFLLTDAQSCSFYAQDVFTKDLPALAVAQPADTGELAALVKTTVAAGHAVIPRGGGMSYTSGYVPAGAGAVIIDMSRMDRVVEINAEDMYVTVECGCTWKALHEALQGTGLRTPYWGTLSGSKATVGGGLSQNSVFWGSGQYGSAVDSVIGLEVVLADGSIVKTGSGAQRNSTPFFRHFGPDLTGLFTCDTGALGFKAVATLRLIPELPARRFLAFDFKTAADALAAMSAVGRRGLAMECFGFDPFLQAQRMKRESLAKDVKALAGVMKSAGSVLGALKEGARIAAAGRGYMDDVDYSVQIIIEERNEAAAAALAAEVRVVGEQFNGREIENSIPKITRANPFGPVNNMLGPQGERWVPIHGLFPHSKIRAAYEAVEALFARHRAAMDSYDIGVGYLFATVSTNCFVLEPVFFWPDAMTEIHQRSLEPDHLARLQGFPEHLEARAAVTKIRDEMTALFTELGAVHLQIGKHYQYREGIRPENWQLIQAIKAAVDPRGCINPQSLGLE